MARLTRRKFKQSWYGGNYRARGSLGLCKEVLRDLFELPKNCLTIWVSLHDTPSEDRVKLDMRDGALDGEQTEFDYHTYGCLLEFSAQAGKKVFHVQVEYEQ